MAAKSAAEEIPAKLRKVIEEYTPLASGYGWINSEGATGQCADATKDFIFFLQHRSLCGSIEHFDFNNQPKDVEDYPLIIPPEKLEGLNFHWCTRIDDWVVDWTARQFVPSAPFPLVFKAPKRIWRG